MKHNRSGLEIVGSIVVCSTISSLDFKTKAFETSPEDLKCREFRVFFEISDAVLIHAKT